MNRSQSWKRIPSEEAAEFKEDRRATSHPNLSHGSSLSNAELRSSRLIVEDLRRKIVGLNKELEAEKAFVKQLRREKSIDLKHAREEEQRRAASIQTDLKTKLHKEKVNELTALREQMHKDKEKEILQIIKQKDDALRTAQQSWTKEKDELRIKLRAELWSEAREESRKEFYRERTRLEQEILDLKMQKKELEDAYKTLQESDKRKADEIRKIFHEHEIELEKFKRNSWQESRRQMGEIRQLLNIIEQLERKLGIDSGHINKLRMEKEGLYEELRKKTNSFDAWDSMMSSSMKTDSDAGETSLPHTADPKYNNVNHELRTLQRKNTELSSLVKKLDEKNQQLATKNAELLLELERNDKDAKDKWKKLEKKNLELTQNTKKLESKNKALQDEINSLKRKPGPAGSSRDVGSKKDKTVRPRGQGTTQTDSPEVVSLKQQIKDQSKSIEELKQNLMEKERRIDLLKERKKSGKKTRTGRTSVDAVLQQEHDDAASVVSDISDVSEMSSTDSNSDANKLKKLTKELLALERAYALLQAQVGGTVDVERDELERQQLQSDLIESQARIQELERMMDSNAQGGMEELQQLQYDNKVLYQKLVAAENERDKAMNELSKNSEDLRDLQDKKDLLEFELEEMSQMSFAGSEDEFPSPRKMREKEDRKLPLSLEEVKAYLEEMEKEKVNVLTVMELEALKQARTSLTALPQKISHLEATESVLRSKVKDLEERNMLENQGMFRHFEFVMGEPETLSEVLDLETTNKEKDENDDQPDSTQNNTDHFKTKQLTDKECVTELTCTLLCDMERIYEQFLRDKEKEVDSPCKKEAIRSDIEKNSVECMTDFLWEDIVEIEETYQEFLSNIEGLDLGLAKPRVKMVDKKITTELGCEDISTLETKGKEFDELREMLRNKEMEKVERESNTDVVLYHERNTNTEVIEKHEMECNTDITWDAMEKEENSRTMMLRIEELENELLKTVRNGNDVEVMTDLVWKDVTKQEELYKEQIEELRGLLVLEQELREADEMKLVDYEMLKEANAARKTEDTIVMTEDVWIEDTEERFEKCVQDLVEKTKYKAVAEVADEMIVDLERCLLERLPISQKDQQTVTLITGEDVEQLQYSNDAYVAEMVRLREGVEERGKRVQELEDKLSNILVIKNELEMTMECMKKESSDREEMYKNQLNELNQKLSMEQELRKDHNQNLLQYEANMARRSNDDKRTMTDVIGIENTDEILERTAREIVEKATHKAMIDVARDVIIDLIHTPAVPKDDQETLTNMSDKDLRKLEEDNQSNILELTKMRETTGQNEAILEELENELSKVFSEKKELETMIENIQKDVYERDQVRDKQIETLREQILYEQEMREADRMKLMEYEALKEQETNTFEDKSVVTEKVCVMNAVQIVEEVVKDIVEKAKNEAIVEVASEDIEDIIRNDIEELRGLTNVIKEKDKKVNELEMELSRSKTEKNELQAMNHHLKEEILEKERLYSDQIEEINEQLSKQQDMRKTTQELEEESMAPDKVWVEDTTEILEEVVHEIVNKAENDALNEVLRETIDELMNRRTILHCDEQTITDVTYLDIEHLEKIIQESSEELTHLRDVLELKEQKIQELEEELLEKVFEKAEVDIMTDVVGEDIDVLENNYREQQYRPTAETCEKDIMTDMSWVEVLQVEEKYEEFRDNIQEIQEKLARVDIETDEVEIMTDLVWEDMCHQEGQIEKLREQLIMEKELREEIQEKLAREDVEKDEVEIMTDLVWEDICNQEQLYMEQIEELREQLIMERKLREEIQEKLAKEDVEKDEVEIMTDLVWEDMCNQEQLYQEQIEELREQLILEQVMKEADKMKLLEYEALRESSMANIMEEKGVMTDAVYIEEPSDALKMAVMDLVETTKNEAIVELANEAVFDVAKEDKDIMTEFSWKEIEYLEKTYREWVEELRQMTEDLRRKQLERLDKSCMTDIPKESAMDVEIMTDLEWNEIVHLENSYHRQKQELQDLKNAQETESEGKGTMTELKWDDIVYLETSYTEKIQELEVIAESIKDDEHAGGKADVDQQVMTDLSWQDVVHLENSYREELEKLEVLADSFTEKEKETMDEEVMTDMKWDEVECQLESYKDQIEHLNEMLEERRYHDNEHGESLLTETMVSSLECENIKLLPWSVDMDAVGDIVDTEDEHQSLDPSNDEKRDAESMTDLTMEAMLNYDNKFNTEAIHNGVEGRQVKECMTELSCEDIFTMEDVSGKEIQRLANTEDKICMTDLIFDDMVSQLERLRLQKLEEQLITDNLNTTDDDHLTDFCESKLKQLQDKQELEQGQNDRTTDDKKQKAMKDTLEPKEPRSSTRMVEFPFNEEFEDSLTREDSSLSRNVDLADQYTSTDITLEDLSYFEDLEVKHHELLLKTKQHGTRSSLDGSLGVVDKNARPVVLNTTDKQTATELTLEDLLYFEKLEVEHHEVMLEKKKSQGLLVPFDTISNPSQDSLSNLEEAGYFSRDSSSVEDVKATVDVKEFENLKSKYDQLLLENERLVGEGFTPEMSFIDARDYKNLNDKYNELLLEKEQWMVAQSEQQLSSVEQKDYENMKEQYNELLTEKSQWEAMQSRRSLESKDDLETSTDLTLDDLEYYEDLEIEYRELQQSHRQLLFQQGDSGKDTADQGIETELTLVDLQSLQDTENEYKNLLLTQQDTRDNKINESETDVMTDQEVCTDISMDHLRYLEDVESIHKRQCTPAQGIHESTLTDLMLTDLHYLEEVEAVHQQCMTGAENDISSSKTDTSEMGVSTEITASVLEYLEEVAVAHKEIVREYEAFRQSVIKDKEDVNLMTELTGMSLDKLSARSEELENAVCLLSEEATMKKQRRRDKALMTELSVENLKNLEESGNVYRELKERGILSRLEQLRKPTRQYSTVTDLLVSNIEYLEEIERLYREQERSKSKVDKATGTEMTQSELKRIENLANNAIEPKNKNQRNGKVNEKSSTGDVSGRHGDRGRLGNAKGVGTVEVGIQCELKDLLSLIRDQQEQDGGSGDSKWFISALEVNKKNKEGFDPVEVVLRRSARQTSTPDVTSRRDHGNKRYSLDSKRHSSNMSLNLDYGWQSTSSLDISGLDKTPKASGSLRWDSPQVPLAQGETFDLSDIESMASEESLLHALQASSGGKTESVVTQFDRYVMARKQSEKDLLSELRENEDEEDGLPRQPKSMADLLKEIERLKIRNMQLELTVAQKGDLSDDELQLLKQKIQQLREAEQQMEQLQDSNTALKDRINQLQEDNLMSGPSTSRSVHDNWSEMDPSEGRTRLLLVQDWGLGESDLESLFSAREGAVSPAESIETSALRRLLDEYAKSDHATQAGPAVGVSQEIQTTGDLLKLIDLSYDGTIPDHIAKELEKLKAENKELYEELLELRRLKLANSKPRNQESRDISAEEPIRSSVQSKAESQNDWFTKLDSLDDDRSGVHRSDDQKKSRKPVKNFDELFDETVPRDKSHQQKQQKYSSRRRIKEPEILSSRSSTDTKADLERGLRNLDVMDDQNGRHRADTDDILDFEFGEDDPPEFAPPPVPTEPPPDLPDNEADDMELGTETVLGSSPPRDSSALRAASRQKSNPTGKTVVGEPAIQASEDLCVQGKPGIDSAVPGRTELPPSLRTNQPRTGPGTRPPATSKPAPPPTLPKPKMSGLAGRRFQGTKKPGFPSTALTRSRESLNDEEGMGLTPRGYVRATASAINQGELDALGEKIEFLEKQLKNKENVIRSMKTEATELENQALLERREREIKILEEDVTFLKQENQKKERELLTKIGELNRKNYEVDQWKAEASNAEKQRKRIESSYMNLQAQTRSLQGSDSKLSGLQSKYSTLEKENKQLIDKVKNLEKTEKEFKQLEYNISVLQTHLQDMESVEKERDDLLNRLKIVEDQRDDLLKKGRMVESERNDFLRNNKIMEMQRDELEQRYAEAHKNQMKFKAAADEMEQKVQDANNKTLDAQHERNYVQAQYNKLETEKNELLQNLAVVTQERNSLETRLAELEDGNREYVKLEDGFHTLRLKAAELTRQRDDFEMQIPTLKAKVALLKKACKEKDEFIDKLNDEIRELRHAIATSTLDDLSKIRSYGYSPENFVKYSGQRDPSYTGDAVDAKPRADGHSSPKSKSKNPGPKVFVAIFDYDPHKASVSGSPESELTLKEGDELKVYGDMDTNGCYEAELNGMRGLVPGLYVEELEDGRDHSLPNGNTGQQEKVRTARGRLTNGHCEPDAISSGHSSMSPRSLSADLEPQRHCYVALYDYEPYQSCTTGSPELELPFKKGDIMTVIGDTDVNGYYKAEMDGQAGLVPSNFVEEVTSSAFLQPTSSSAPEQILSMLDNIKVPSPQRSGASLPLPMPSTPNTNTSFPTHLATVSLVPSGHVAQPVPMVTKVTPRRDQPIQPIFTPYMSPAEVHKLASPITSTSSTKSRARTSQRSPRQQATSSPRSRGATTELSPPKQSIPIQPMASPPQLTSKVHRSPVQGVSKPKPRQSKVLVASHPKSVGQRGPPNPPSSLHVLRPVNHDAILLGWALPEMDEFGRSNGVVVKGYKIYENGDYKMDVKSQFMTKALVDDLDLRYPILFTVRTVGADGSLSSDVSTTFTDTINNSRMSISKAIESTVGNSNQRRIFVALYDYDPMKSSPNSNPQYELKFNEGDILRVEDTSRKDGFYFGSLNDKKGLIPSNFVEEVAVAKTLGPSSPTRKQPGSPRAITNGTTNGTISPNPTPRHRKKMIALYDYNPNEQSPLDNPRNELSLKKGKEVTVLGIMNKDGYYKAEINGRKGLVPASFVESSEDTSSKVSHGNNMYRN